MVSNIDCFSSIPELLWNQIGTNFLWFNLYLDFETKFIISVYFVF